MHARAQCQRRVDAAKGEAVTVVCSRRSIPLTLPVNFWRKMSMTAGPGVREGWARAASRLLFSNLKVAMLECRVHQPAQAHGRDHLDVGSPGIEMPAHLELAAG